jgi:CDK inhibitor PHO81
MKASTPDQQDLDQVKKVFFFKIEREVEKINEFYIEKEAEFVQRLQTLTHKMQTPTYHLKDGFIQFQLDLAKLQKFVQINATGFRKILKKWDKRSHAHTKEIYLSRKIEIQPCFNNDILSSLAEKATKKLSELEKLLMKNDHTTDHTDFLSKLKSRKDLQSFRKFDKDFLSRVFLESWNILDFDVLKNLVQSTEIDFNCTNDVNNHTCVHDICINGNINVLELVLEKADLEALDYYGRSCLHYACMYGHMDICRVLIEAGVDVFKADQDGNTALIYAVIGGHLDCVKLLMEKSCYQSCETFQNPLSVACQFGWLEIVQLLVQKNVEQVANLQGMYPLHLACREGNEEIVKCLLDSHADIEVKDSFKGYTPVFFCASGGHLGCLKLLLNAGCDIFVTDDNNWTPVIHCLYMGHLEAAELLANALPKDAPKVVPSQALGPSQLFQSLNPSPLMDMSECALDDIPSLSLPPPIIPLRIYGHHYLDKQYLIQVELGLYQGSTRRDPIMFTTPKEFNSLQLKISCQTNIDLDKSHTTNLPLKDDLTTYSIKVESLTDIHFEFDIFPSYGTTCLGRAGLSSTVLKKLYESDGIQSMEYFVCLFDPQMKVIGELQFRVSIIKPFQHQKLLIDGKVDTYWKATSDSVSQVTSSSLAKEFVEVQVQYTKDSICVCFNEWVVETGVVKLPVSNFTSSELELKLEKVDLLKLSSITDSHAIVEFCKSKYLTLNQALKVFETNQALPTKYWYRRCFKISSSRSMQIHEHCGPKHEPIRR